MNAPASTPSRLRGIVAATVLPFDEDGGPDLAAYAGFVESLVAAGVGGLAVNADSGEGMSLWPEERRAVMRTAAEAAAGRVPLVSGVIAASTDQACRAAAEAAADGATNLMVFPSVHFLGSPLDAEVPLGHLRAIHDASGLPIVAFQLQAALGGVEYTPEVLTEILAEPYVTAIKESTFDAHRFRATMDLVRRVAPEVSFLSGNDNFIYESFLLGADGSLMGAGSVATSLQVEMLRAVQERRWEEAEELDRRLLPLMSLIFRAPIRDYRARIKAALRALGELDSARVREPLLELGRAEVTEIERALAMAGLKARSKR